MAKVLGAIAGFCTRHRLLVLGAWVLMAITFIGLLATVGPKTNNDLTLPGTGSQSATDLLAAEFPPQQNGGSPIVYHAPKGKLTGSDDTKAISDSVKAMLKVPHVYSAPDPTANSAAGLISKDGTTAFSSVLLDIGSGDLTPELAQQIVDANAPATKAGMTVEAGGPIGSSLSSSHSESSEVIGILAAVVILTFTFGSLAAMSMPIMLAILGLIVALGVVGMLGHVINIASTGPTLATMIGLGVGIDYALFLVTRHRENLRAGMEVHQSAVNAVSTSGSAVVFAGTTVVIALLALGVAGIPLVTSLGYATVVAVITAVLAAITLLPAVLALLGPRINSGRLPRWLHPDPKPEGHGLWAAWARSVTRYRWVAIGLALALLAPLIVPLFSLHLGQEDIGVTAETTTERKAFDQLSAAFGPGYNGPLLVALSLAPAAASSPDYADDYAQATAMKADLESKQTILTNRSNSLKSQQSQLEAEQASLQQQGDDLKKQQSSLEQQEKALKSQQASLEAQQKSLERQAAVLQQRGASLQRQADRLNAEKTALRRQETSLRAQAVALERQAQQLRREQQALRRQRQALVAEARTLSQRIVVLDRQQAQIRAAILRLDAQIRAATDPLQRIALIRARQAAERQLALVVRQEAAARAQRRQLPAQARRLAAQERALVQRAAVLVRRAQALRREAAALRRQAASLARQAASLARQAAALKRQAANLQSQASSLQRQANSLKAQGNQLQQEGSALQKQADSLNAQGAQLQKEGDSLQAQGDDLKAEQTDATNQQNQATLLQTQLTDQATAAGGDDRGTDPRLVSMQNALGTPQDVQLVSPPNISKSGTAATFTVIPKSRPAAVDTADLVGQMRDSVIPPATASGVTAYVGGSTAGNADLAAKIADKLPLVIGTIIGLSFVLLMVAFRSLLIPVQAAITNLLSAAAAFGVLTACFQWGWGLSLIGLPSPYGTVPIASFVPLMMFAALFGLSMDYEVFFVSSVQHHHAAGDDVRTAVRRGLEGSAKVIVAAAVIMLSVFASFVLTNDPTIKQFGVGLSVAVFLAGLMVILLAPALLTAFGKGTFWVPRWLGRILPHLDLEGPPPTASEDIVRQPVPVGATGEGAAGSPVEPARDPVVTFGAKPAAQPATEPATQPATQPASGRRPADPEAVPTQRATSDSPSATDPESLR